MAERALWLCRRPIPVAPGHFPGNPMIPGALLLDQVIAAIAGPHCDAPVVIRSAKFLRIVRPGEHLDLRWQALGDGRVKFECLVDEALASDRRAYGKDHLMSEKILAQEWLERPERGSPKLLRFGIWTALRIGRRASRLFLYPVCLYFMAFSPAAIGYSRDYLNRALGRVAKFADIFRHFLSFAGCLLDRVYLLNEQFEQFEIVAHGEEFLQQIEADGGGCMLFGAHFGSFEVPRALGRQRERQISLLMYEENAKKIRAALSAINPRLGHRGDWVGKGRFAHHGRGPAESRTFHWRAGGPQF